LDTRGKIVPFDRLSKTLNEGRWTAVFGYFDPLTAEQANRLSNLKNGDRLLALIFDREDALLPVEGRASLIAALRDVDSVAIVPNGFDPDFSNLANVNVISELEEDANRSVNFAAFVLRRQQVK
jgi:hypothetical protein